MKLHTKRLVLNKQTLRTLDHRKLVRVVGADDDTYGCNETDVCSQPSECGGSCGCVTNSCPEDCSGGMGCGF